MFYVSLFFMFSPSLFKLLHLQSEKKNTCKNNNKKNIEQLKEKDIKQTFKNKNERDLF